MCDSSDVMDWFSFVLILFCDSIIAICCFLIFNQKSSLLIFFLSNLLFYYLSSFVYSNVPQSSFNYIYSTSCPNNTSEFHFSQMTTSLKLKLHTASTYALGQNFSLHCCPTKKIFRPLLLEFNFIYTTVLACTCALLLLSSGSWHPFSRRIVFPSSVVSKLLLEERDGREGSKVNKTTA